MAPPEGCSSSDIGVGQWKPGMTFGEFAEVRNECSDMSGMQSTMPPRECQQSCATAVQAGAICTNQQLHSLSQATIANNYT